MLKIIKAKPNPFGKDHYAFSTPQQQLAGEWVDIKNESSDSIRLDDLELHHWAYTTNGEEWEKVLGFSGTLSAGYIVRVHSGESIPISEMLEVDRIGANHHLFTGKNYVWNNDKLDKPSILSRESKGWVDNTWYDAYPGEGVILKRSYDGHLIP